MEGHPEYWDNHDPMPRSQTSSRSAGDTNLDLREAGLKVTAPRLKILELFEKSRRRHLSAEELFGLLRDAGEEIGLATIYRVLTQFEKAGLINRHRFESGHSVFELEQGQHHDHIVCVKCSRVDEFVDELIESRQRDVATRLGYEMTDHSLHIYGLCPDCRTAD